MDSIIGSVVLEFLGAYVRWMFLFIYSKLTNKKVKTFKEVWDGKGIKDGASLLSYGTSNIIIGVIFSFIIIYTIGSILSFFL